MGRLEAGGAIAPLADAEGWLVTRDRGALRDGHLWYLGRLDDQINVAGVKLGAEALEAGIAAMVPAAAGRVAAAALPDPARGEAVLLACEVGAGAEAASLAPVIEAAARAVLARPARSR
jgi:acyl-coenzyme A synthetase/AMP-(fatty) acid ligase